VTSEYKQREWEDRRRAAAIAESYGVKIDPEVQFYLWCMPILEKILERLDALEESRNLRGSD
jgi:hypothetical protein